MKFKRALFCLFFAMVVPAMVHAGTVRTLDGKVLDGEIRLEEGHLVVASKGQSPVSVQVDQILRVELLRPAALVLGVELVDGTSFAVDRVVSMDEQVLKYRQGKSKDLEVDVERVARINFAPAGEPGEAGSGVLLTNGDFLASRIERIESSRIKATSVLYGPREFEVSKQVAAIILRPSNPVQEQWAIRLADGSTVASPTIAIHAPFIDTASRSFQLKDIASLSCASSRLVQVEEGEGNVAGIVDSSADQGPQRRLAIKSGVPCVLHPDGRYQTLVAQFAIRDGTLPTISGRIIAKADGKVVYSKSGIRSCDDALQIAIKVLQVKELELILESSEPSIPLKGVLIQPFYVISK